MESEGGAIFLVSHSEPCAATATAPSEKIMKGKMVKGDFDSVGGAPQKKMLADITNLQQRPIPSLNQQKQQSAPLAAADISNDQLLQDIAMLKKLLANRNAIIESCKVDLQKSQSNFQKLRKQNAELSLTNSQMLAELNSSRQRLRELRHELGIKDGIIKAMKLELTAKDHIGKSKHDIDANEVGASQGEQSDQTQEDNKGDNLCHAKRRRLCRSQSSDPAFVKQAKSPEKVDNQRYCLRRQSKAEKPGPGPAEDFFGVDEIKYDVSHLQENLANESGPTSLGHKVHEEARESTESSGCTDNEQILAKKNVEKKRHSLKRQSARFKHETPEPTEDYFEMDDAKFAISHLCDYMSEKSDPTTSGVTCGQEDNACKSDPRELRRSSIGRPLRRTVEKVQSYKEIPLNVKMRRPN